MTFIPISFSALTCFLKLSNMVQACTFNEIKGLTSFCRPENQHTTRESHISGFLKMLTFVNKSFRAFSVWNISALCVQIVATKCVQVSDHVCLSLPPDEVNRGGPRAFHRQLLQSVQRSAHLRVPKGCPL